MSHHNPQQPPEISAGFPFAVRHVQVHGARMVYVDEGSGRGMWLPVDPTLNQFPADATHVRLARGGLEKQTAILPLVGHLKMTILDLELAPNSRPILADTAPADLGALAIPLPRRKTCCACSR